ncbi:hypothetical protein [Planomicrobium okeanokoites]|uniref:hypothetical protein n=1 Tax=Planomicrobium okeanokoites TaxID=244 RepID=UPI00248F9D88|nr:hypothetical protein [Planomicrobium okeanokoites]
MKKKIHLAILLFTSVYFLMRLTMLYAMANKNHLFIYKNTDLDLLLPSADIISTMLFFFSLYHFFKSNRPMKYISIALMAFFIPFTILASFLYTTMNADDEHSRHRFNSADDNKKFLVVIGHMKGLHPDNSDPRDIYLYEKTAPFIYEKLGQCRIELDAEDLKVLSDMKVNVEELSVEINERMVFFEKNK